jgi:uncharacterized protein
MKSNTKTFQKRHATLLYCILFLLPQFSSKAQCAQKSDKSAIELIKDGYEKFKEKNYEDAAKLYSQVDRNDSNYVIALIELVNCNQLLKRDSLNLALCDELINRYPNERISGLVLKANAYDNMNQFDKAREMYTSGHKSYPHAHTFVYELGLAYLKGKKYKEAHNCFRQVIKMNPLYAPAHLQMATMAVRQNKFVPAILAYEFFLINENQSKRAQRVVTFIESAVKGEINEEADEKFSIPEYKDLDNFEELESLLKSKIAISGKYKSKIDLNYNLTKQMQLISEKVHYLPADTGFYMQFYAKFFEALEKKEMFEPFTYHVLSGMQVAEIEKWSKRHEDDLQKFRSWCYTYLKENYLYYTDELRGDKGEYTHYYTNSKLSAMTKGKGNADNKQGEWTYFYPNGNMKSYGPYINNEQKGEWHYFYESGNLKEVVMIGGGKVNGSSINYFNNGALKNKLNYLDGLLDGEQITYHENGTIKGRYNFKKDIKDGIEKEYYTSGQLRYEGTYAEGKAVGVYREFYESGNLEGEFYYVNGKRDGKLVNYFDGAEKILKAEGAYAIDKESGEWKFYDEQKNLIKKGSFDKDGKRMGSWLAYYSNGKLKTEENYGAGGKLNGPYKYYTEAGAVIDEFTYKNGKLTDYKQFDRNGKLLAEGNRERKKIELKIYHDNGNIKRQGILENNLSVGEWVYYDVNGVLYSKFNFKDDLENGPSTVFFSDGNKRSELDYKEGKAEGCFMRYNEFGVLVEEGLYKNDMKEGYWYIYNNLGIKIRELFYKENALVGLQYYFANNGRLSKVSYMNESSFEEWTEYYDTLGKLKQTIPFKPGKRDVTTTASNGAKRTQFSEENGILNGKLIRYYPNGKVDEESDYKYDKLNGTLQHYNIEGKVIYKATYLNDELHGVATSYYDNGTIREETEYKNGRREGKWITYHPNGKKEREMKLKDDELDGISMNYDDAGEIVVKRYYEHDNLVYYQYLDAQGKYTTPVYIKDGNIDIKAFFKNGKPSLVYSVRNGDVIGKRTGYHSNGAIVLDEELKLGVNIGTEKLFYSNGKPYAVFNYKNGKLHGLCTYYNENGTVKKTLTYNQNEEWGESKIYDGNGKLLHTIYYYDGIPESIK